MTYDRETRCNVHTTAAACNADVTNRCIHTEDVMNIIEAIDAGAAAGAGNSSHAATKGGGGSSSSGSSSSGGGSTSRSGGSSRQATTELLDPVSLAHELHVAQRDLLGTFADSPLLVGSRPLAEVARIQQQQQQQQQRQTQQQQQKQQQQQPKQQQQQQKQQQPADDGAPVCTSRDLLENYLFTRAAYSNLLQAPLSMHCPGSKAYELVRCMRTHGAGVGGVVGASEHMGYRLHTRSDS
jgi:hypothetical protein